MSHDDLLPLIETIYQAGLEPDQWWTVLSGIVAAFDGTATLFIQDPTADNAAFLGCAGMDASFMAQYNDHFAALNPARHVWPVIPEGTIVDAASLMDEQAFMRTEFYNDFFRPMDVHHAIGSVVQKAERTGTHLALQRARRAGAYTEAERTRLLVLGRHIRRSIEISRRLTAAGWMREAASSPVKSIASGFVFVDPDGRVLLADPIAEAIFRDDNGLTVSNGRLRATAPDQMSRLMALIRTAAATAAGKTVPAGGRMGLPRRRLEGPPLALLICPWHGNPAIFGVNGPAALIFVEDPNRLPKPTGAGAAALYGLTPAETKLLEALLRGSRVAEHAAEAKISIATARTHLRSIFAKTGERRQADLVRLVLSSGIARSE